MNIMAGNWVWCLGYERGTGYVTHDWDDVTQAKHVCLLGFGFQTKILTDEGGNIAGSNLSEH